MSKCIAATMARPVGERLLECDGSLTGPSRLDSLAIPLHFTPVCRLVRFESNDMHDNGPRTLGGFGLHRVALCVHRVALCVHCVVPRRKEDSEPNRCGILAGGYHAMFLSGGNEAVLAAQ